MTKEDKIQIIIIRGPDVTSDYGDSVAFIESITEWDMVTRAELDILIRMSYQNDFKIVERNPIQTLPSKALLRTPRDYLNKWQEDEKKLEEKRAEAAAKRAEKKTQDDVKTIERKRKQFEKLKHELGEK